MDDEALGRALLEWLSANGPANDGALASALSVAPDRIARCTRTLARMGLPVEPDQRGLRTLTNPVGLLDRDAVLSALRSRDCEQLDALQLVWQTGSTNSDLLAQEPPLPGKLRVRLAEFQGAGRGRHGRRWRAPLGSSILMSLAWTFSRSSRVPAGLTIAAGVTVREVLVGAGIRGVQLKWPNDLVARECKLGGVLAELRHGADRRPSVVLGVGINYRLPKVARSEITALGGLPPVDIIELGGDHAPGRGALAAALIVGFVEMFRRFESEGLAPFVAAWRDADVYRNRNVVVTTPSSVLRGVARGIDASGALRLDIDGCEKQIVSAEVSLSSA